MAAGRLGLCGGGRGSMAAHFEEAAMSAVVLAVVARVVTIDELEGVAIVTEPAEGP